MFSNIKKFIVRYNEAGDLLEIFLVSAVVSLISIRVFLSLTGYPQIGGGHFHIAHMLWGGLGMLVAILSMFVLLNNEVKYFAAIIGGIGFGAFIDELGKFLTADKNYFFQPSIALIYVIFVMIFLLSRYFENDQRLTNKEYIINTLEIVKDIFSHDFDSEDKKKALKFLKKVDSKDPFIKDLQQLIQRVKVDEDDANDVIRKLKHNLHKFYLVVIEKKWFKQSFFLVFVVSGVYSLARGFYFFSADQDLSFWTNGYIFSAALSGLLIVIGFITLRSSRMQGYLWFKRGVLVSIFLTQFFLFYKDQLSAVVGLGVSVFFLVIIQYFIDQEKKTD